MVTSASSSRPSTPYETTLSTLSSSPHTSAENTARRARSGSVTKLMLRRLVGQHVAHTTHGVYKLHAVIPVNLVAQRVDVHFHDVADAVEVDVPDVLDDQRSCERAIAVAHEELEQRVLLRLE